MKTITPESAKELIDSLADKELSFGCEVVEISHKKNHKISWVNKEKETYGLNGIGGAFEMKDRDIDIAILGHPILIGNILEKIRPKTNGRAMARELVELWGWCGFNCSLEKIVAEGWEEKIEFIRPCIKCECGDECKKHNKKVLKPEVEALLKFIKELNLK